MKILFLALTASILLACANTKELATNQDDANIKKATLGEIGEQKFKTNIVHVSLKDNVLNMVVNYSGGCQEQDFELVGSTMIMKSLPPKRGVALVRDSKGDNCRELITDTLHFDISALAYKQEDGSEIILNLIDYTEAIPYTYVKD